MDTSSNVIPWSCGAQVNSCTMQLLGTMFGHAARSLGKWRPPGFTERHCWTQDIRLRTQIEQDAFARMTPYWQQLGFPFERLVSSYATAIGNSSDRPTTLAELMGIIVNDGELRSTIRLEEFRFAPGTPYHTVM